MLVVALTVLASALLVYAALHDLAARTVPNWLPAVLLALGLCARLADHSLLSGLAVAAGMFALLFLLWVFRAMGGGDVKLWAATALVVPPMLQAQLAFFERVVVFGGILAIFYLCLWPLIRKPRASRAGGMFRRVLRAEAWRIGKKAPLPYACAIAGGAIATLLPLTFSVR